MRCLMMLVTLVLLMTAMLIVTMGPALAVGRALPQDGHTLPRWCASRRL
jgi:hypothetical protein